MQMEVEDGLAALFAVVNDHPVAVSEPLLASHLIGHHQQVPQQLQPIKHAAPLFSLAKDYRYNFIYSLQLGCFYLFMCSY